MVVFVHRSTYISVIRLESVGKMSENLGKIYRTKRNRWVWETCYRSIGNDTLNGSEKRQIIGLLDDLNHVYYRLQSDMRNRWEQITGLKLTK